jgi:outer membrane protein assembly factor BamD (BamD/ComL family)/predicted transcriptional regulator
VVRSPVPQPLLDTVKAREEYARIVPPAADVLTEYEGVKVPQAMAYAFDNANAYFLYGDFAEARKRFEPIYAEQCGKTPFGYKAWERLTTMSNLENDVEKSRVLAEAALTRSCAITEEQKLKEEGIAKPTISRGYYLDAARAYEKAEKMAPGPDRDKAWREAAALYKVALEKAPARDEAPEAAILGANAYKQVGEYDQAIAMYELFIREYGNEQKLAALEKGDPKAEPPVAPNPAKYQERVDNLKLAYDELSKAYILFFSYRQAAETYDTVSRNGRFAKEARRTAAKNALVLYSNLGDEPKVLSSRQTLFSLDPPAKERAEVDYLVVLSDLKQWDENGADDGANRNARVRAMQSMEAYYQRNRTNDAAAAFVLQAAYNASKMHRIGRDGRDKDWCSNTIKAFDGFKRSVDSTVGSIEADMAAECAYLAVDEQLKAKFDYDAGFHRYSGVIDKVKQAFDKDMNEANDVWFPKLQAVIETYASPKWSVAARARQGSLYDSCRTGLYNATPPAVKLYTDKEEKLLKLAEESDRDDLLEQADAIRQNRREQWRAARERSLEDADKAMVKFYAESVVWARGYKVRTPAVDHAIRRLAFFTDILGNQKMRDYTQGIVDPSTKQPFVYQDNAFLRSRPGLTAPLAADGLPTPLPVSP